MAEKSRRAACALERLFEAHERAIYSHCVRLLGDAASAQDLTQEVFLRVRCYAGPIPEAEQARPWLFRIATNRCLNELRWRAVRARAAPELSQSVVGNSEDAQVAQSDARRLLAKLSPRARAITWLTHVDGMQQQEVADSLGVSRRTVTSELHRVRERFERSWGKPHLALAR